MDPHPADSGSHIYSKKEVFLLQQRSQGGAQGAGAPLSDLDTRLILMYNYQLILIYLGKDIVSTLTCKQNLKFKVRTLGVLSRFGACANLLS